MVNKNYVRGRRKEYKIVEKLRSKGFNIVFRSAGSHSPIDVVGIHKKARKILLIQSKPNSMSENAKKKLCDAQKDLWGWFWVDFRVE